MKIPALDSFVSAVNRHPLNQYLIFSALVAPVLYLGTAHALRYDFLCDDAYISFRYARNFMEGNGLVFNVGERVEGYTNFLWVLEIASLWKLFGLTPEIGSRLLSYGATVGTYVLVLLWAMDSPFRRERLIVAWWAMVCLALNRSFAVWGSSGLETRQFTFFIVLAFYLFQFREQKPKIVLGSAMAFAAAAMTRPEGVQVWAVFCFCHVLEALARQRLRVDFVLYLASFLVPVLLHFCFRYFYYGDWLPNTYYAKFVRPWPEAGFNYFTLATLENGLYLWVPLAVVGCFARLRLSGDSCHAIYLLVIAAYCAAMGRVGGDHFEFRLLDFFWPFLALSAVEGAYYLVFRLRKSPKNFGLGSRFLAGAVLIVPLTYMGSTQWARYCASYGLETRDETFHLAPKLTVESFPTAFLLPGMDKIATTYNASLAYCVEHDIALSQTEHKVFWQLGVDRWFPYHDALAVAPLPDDLVAAYPSIGVYSYSLRGLEIVDTLGLTDAYVARLPCEIPNKDRNMAHDRLTPADYLKSRNVNIQIFPATETVEEALGTCMGSRFFPTVEFALALPDGVWMPFEVFFAEQTRVDIAQLFSGREVWTRLDPTDANSPPVLLSEAMSSSVEPTRALMPRIGLCQKP